MTSDQLHPSHENGTEPASQESICESKVYHHTKNKDGRDQCKEQLQDSEPTKNSEDDEDSPYALIVRRRFSEKREVESTTVCINSPLIHKAFQDVIGSYPTVASDFKSSFKLESPFQILLHYWDPLEAYRDEADSPRMRQHLNLLFRFMEEEMGPERRTLQHMLQKQMITFKQAWVIYRPGDLVVSEVLGKSWLSRVEKVSYGTSRNRGPAITLRQTIQPRSKDFQFIHESSVTGARPDLETELLERGKKFITNRGILTKDYDGIAEWLKEPPLDFFDPNMADYPPIWLPFTETGRVVLDRKTFEEDNYSHVTMIEEVDDPELFLCPPYALGYSTGRKEWCRYLVDNLRDVAWKENAWSSLILDQEQKQVLKALVMSHKHPERVRSLSEQKGKGLVVLLHGTPGSGKTLSAETAAEMSKKALLSTSMSELNRYDRLKQILQYATTWNAIILFDEADVFLESRDLTSNSTTRNALVAVFLKHLEYFSGIVFLTTSRLSSIDAAMKSRIHLSLSFGPPEAEVRRQIWKQNLEAVPVDETEIGGKELSSQAAEDLIHHKLNGREMSNALNTARTLARFEEVKLSLQHIETVLKVGQTFRKHIET
ncbi:TOB3 (member of AAA-ATPase family) [Fusarium subglutinans]|uniref:TOB3 (Member of AAA-ATPase family) n=1 Tax=Gibberella subglutinans TaxID=42677 RepID=A0A8H5QEH7_GIBSU|nr:TOB3 (member of AAA-ATPase family) [Fusarium subglutinans]KAF5613304.1 TOB3 (member of AAA-ATPase family) [Fusarium subglutinans]